MWSRRGQALRFAVAAMAVAAPMVAWGHSADAAEATGYVVHAAPSGSGHACTLRKPCTLGAAKVKAAKTAHQARADVHVMLADGTYRLTSPLVFGPHDSGVGGHRIIWEPAPGAKPVISGGTPVTGWAPVARNPGLWQASVPAGLRTRQLFADGRRIPRTSGPSPVTLTQTSTGFVASDDTLASWRNPSDLEFIFDAGHGHWTQPRCDVAAIEGKTITMRQPCWSNMRLPGTPKAPDGDNPSGGFLTLPDNAVPSRIENAYELLKPGTWYLDEAKHVIYYDARPSEDVNAMAFVAPVLQQLLTTSSTADDPLEDVTFTGITFAYATWLQPSSKDGFVEMQANMTVTGQGGSTSQGLCNYVDPPGSCPFAAWTREPAAVDLVGTRNVSVLDSIFEHLGGAGLGAYHGARGDLLSGNEVTDVSGNGIEFGTTDDPQPTGLATNLSGGGRAWQSSTMEDHPAWRAVDADPRSSSSTQSQEDPWWQLDLGSAKPLWQTVLTPSSNEEPLSDFWIFVSRRPFDHTLTPVQQAAKSGVWSIHKTAPSTTVTVPTDTTGRYVMVQEVGVHALALGDVAVKSGAEIAVGNTVKDNYVHNIGVEYTGAVGIWAGYSRKTTITHNELGNLPYSGISFGWGGWHTNATTPDTNPNVMADNVISDNVIYDYLQTRWDGGAVYTNGPQGQSIQHGLKMDGNVTFGNPRGTAAYYTDEGGAYIVIDGDVQYAHAGPFNGGCSTTGHIIVKNSYHAGLLNHYHCTDVGTDFRDGGGNELIPINPIPGVIPTDLLSTAGLQEPYRTLGRAYPPQVIVVSPLHKHNVLVSGAGFTPTARVSIDGVPATETSYIGPNQLVATFPWNVEQGNVSVSTAAGTSAISDGSYTSDPSMNVALGKPADQSSTYSSSTPAARAVDGDTTGSNPSFAHTRREKNAWWQVDLGSAQALESVDLWNRTGCCTERDTDYWVFVSSAPFDHTLTPSQQASQPGVWSSHQAGTIGRPSVIPTQTTGRYVMIQLAGTNYLALAEVQVLKASQ